MCRSMLVSIASLGTCSVSDNELRGFRQVLMGVPCHLLVVLRKRLHSLACWESGALRRDSFMSHWELCSLHMSDSPACRLAQHDLGVTFPGAPQCCPTCLLYSRSMLDRFQ